MPYRSFRFSGTESKKFLQGQLTQDVNTLNTDNCQYAAYCNHKGRMLANLLLNTFVSDNDSICFRLHEAQKQIVINRLKMFILRSDVFIDELPYIHIGMNFEMVKEFCHLKNIPVPLPFSAINHTNWKLCALPNNFFELILFSENSLIATLSPIKSIENKMEINKLRLISGNFNVLEETSEVILPQQTPLEAWGGISYTKGCYVGQEIIARNKYLGKVKKGLAFAVIKTKEILPLCTDVKSCEGKLVGKLIEYQMTTNGLMILVVLSLDMMSTVCKIDKYNVNFNPVLTKG